jgi:hypothetical protein
LAQKEERRSVGRQLEAGFSSLAPIRRGGLIVEAVRGADFQQFDDIAVRVAAIRRA